MILIVFCRDRSVNCRKAAKPPWGVCVTKNASHAANVRVYGACAAAACNPKSKKAAFAAFFEVLY